MTRRPPAPDPGFYDRDYFEGTSRGSVPHTRERIYPTAERTAALLWRRWRPRRALDLGCARGYLVEALLARGVEAFGIDISAFAVGGAEPPVRGRLLVGAVESGLPIRSGVCDLVTAVDLFEHLPEPDPVLREIRRILAAAGVAYLKICHPRHPNARRDPSHVNVRPLGYWRRAFRRAGFRAVRLYEADFLPPGAARAPLRAWVRRTREWAVIGTPADYKFVLSRRTRG